MSIFKRKPDGERSDANVVELWERDTNPLHDRPPMDWSNISDLHECPPSYEESNLASLNPEYIAVCVEAKRVHGVFYVSSMPDLLARMFRIKKWSR